MRTPESPALRNPRPRSVPVFILCGGQGTRLRGVDARPKAVIPVAGIPFLTYTLRLLWLQGFREAHLLLGHGADEVRAAFAGKGIAYSMEAEPLGTGGALGLARDRAARFNLILNADSYAEAIYSDLLEAQAKLGGAAARGVTLLALPVDERTDYGGLEIDSDGRVTAFLEKGAAGSGWINAGVYVAGRAFVRELPASVTSLERDVLPRLARSGRLWALKRRFFFRDIGTPDRLEAAQAEFVWIRDRMGPAERLGWGATAPGGPDAGRDESGGERVGDRTAGHETEGGGA
jgi:D-glycero-alpha-D-manno-heptose 1-phosphate guanylyltransferase